MKFAIFVLLCLCSFLIGWIIYDNIRIYELRKEYMRCQNTLTLTAELCSESWIDKPITEKEKKYFIGDK